MLWKLSKLFTETQNKHIAPITIHKEAIAPRKPSQSLCHMIYQSVIDLNSSYKKAVLEEVRHAIIVA